jgi:hypothetical protein
MYSIFQVWESEEWLQRHLKPLSQSGGQVHILPFYTSSYRIACVGVQARTAKQNDRQEPQNLEPGDDDAMEE